MFSRITSKFDVLASSYLMALGLFAAFATAGLGA
jgi:hypothetical protein